MPPKVRGIYFKRKEWFTSRGLVAPDSWGRRGTETVPQWENDTHRQAYLTKLDEEQNKQRIDKIITRGKSMPRNVKRSDSVETIEREPLNPNQELSEKITELENLLCSRVKGTGKKRKKKKKKKGGRRTRRKSRRRTRRKRYKKKRTKKKSLRK